MKKRKSEKVKTSKSESEKKRKSEKEKKREIVKKRKSEKGFQKQDHLRTDSCYFIFQRISTRHNGSTGANYFGIFIATVAPVPPILGSNGSTSASIF